MFVEGQTPELNGVTRLVDRLICLDEHGIAFVHVTELGGVLELESAGAAHRDIVVAWADVADLDNKLVRNCCNQSRPNQYNYVDPEDSCGPRLH